MERTGGGVDSVLSRFGMRSDDLRDLLDHSVLAYLAVEKFLLSRQETIRDNIEGSRPDPAGAEEQRQEEIAATAIVRALRAAYGANLIVVYVPEINATSGEEPEPIDKILQSICSIEGVGYVSVRDAMMQRRRSRNELPEGFRNTLPGTGHLNSLGHEIVGEEVWRAVSSRK
ncbi:MAG: hypothetical protein ABI878_10865 [Acidobacteriota bacterium]